MVNATKDMFSKYAVFTGRTSRADFWWATLGYILLSMVVGFIGGFICGIAGIEAQNASPIVSGIWTLATLLPALGLEIRRLHDINKSGWFVLISLIPFVGTIILIVFFCLPAVNEGNSY